MPLRHQPPPSPLEQQQMRAAEPMWPVWIALTVLGLSTGALVAILVGFTGKSLHTSGWFWLSITLGTIAGLVALAFQTRSRMTRRMQTALIVSLIVHVIMTFVFKESFLAMLSQNGKKAGAVTKPMPTMPDYFMPSPTGATVRQAFDRPVETERAETSPTETVRSNEVSRLKPRHRPTLQQSDVAEAIEPTPMELERQSQAAPRRVNEMSRLSRQDLSEAKLAAPRNVRSPRQSFRRPQQQRSELQAPDSQTERRQAEAPRARRSSETTRQTAMANATNRQMERARSETTPRAATPSAERPNRTRAESSRIAETQARDLNPSPARPTRSQSQTEAVAEAAASSAERLSRSAPRSNRAAAARAMAAASASADQVAALSRSSASRRSAAELRPNLDSAPAASNTPRRATASVRSSSSSAADIAAPASATAQSSATGDAVEAPSAAVARRMSGSRSGASSRARAASSGGGPPSNQVAAIGGITTSRRQSDSALAPGTSTATASGISRSSSSSSRATTSGSASQIAGPAAAAAAGAQAATTAQGPSAAASQVARRSAQSGRSGRRRSRTGESDADTLSAAAASTSSGSPRRRGDRSQPAAGDIAAAAPNTSISRRSSRARALSGTDAAANAPAAPQITTPGDGNSDGNPSSLAATSEGQPTRRSTRSGRPRRATRGESDSTSDQVAAAAANSAATNQPRRATANQSTVPDLFDVASSPQTTRRSNRPARMATSETSADTVEAPSPTGVSEENSASESVTADTLEPNSGIDRVASRVPVRNSAATGPGGLASELAATAGIPTRRASRQSQLVHNAPERFLRKSAGGRASLSGKARDIHPAFARRTQRRTDPTAKGSLGQPSAEVEASIEMGLTYIASVQQPDGRWSLQKTVSDGAADPDPTVSIRADSAATGLALLSFLGAGYDHLEDRYAKQVADGLEFLIANQKPNGDLYVKTNANAANNGLWFYSHGIAAIALCEAYGMTGDPQLKQPAQRSIDFIVNSQHPERGGWRYDPNRMSDLSVSGWQLMALRSAQLAGLKVPESAIKGTQRLLDAAQAAPDDGSRYCYNPWGNDTEKGRYGPRPNTTMTAVGLMMRLYTGWKKDRPDMQRGADHLAARLPVMESPPGFAGTGNPQRDTYYWYSGTIVMYHLQGEHWERWKEKLYPMLASTQQREGQLVGSWNPRKPMSDRWAISAGRLYLTTLNLLSLEVHHRHLPLFSDGLELQNEQ